LAGFHHQHAHRHAADDPVANGEILWRGERSYRKFGDQCAPERENLIGEPAVFAGIVDVDSGAEDGGSLRLGGDSAPVRGRVHAAGHATNNDDPTGRKVARESLRHPQAVRVGCRVPTTSIPGIDRMPASPRTYSATGGS